MTDETRKVLEEALAIPSDTLTATVGELSRSLHVRALEYVGEMPGADAEAYLQWVTKMEAYKLAAAWSLLQFETLP